MKGWIIAFTCVIAMTFMSTTVVASADTLSDLKAQVSALLAQLMQLQQGAPVSAVVQSGGYPCVVLGRNLSRGSRGDDVALLQRFLIQQNLLPSDSATGYFGPMTEGAIQRWQTSQGIVSSGDPYTTGYGSVGPRTRSFLARCSGGVSAGTVNIPRPTGSCLMSSSYLPDGSSKLMYSAPSVTWPQTCSAVGQLRTCIRGVLSGTSAYMHETCSESAAPVSFQPCFIASTTIQHGASATFFSQTNVESPTTCSSVSQSRTCMNGVMSGDSSHRHLFCSQSNASQVGLSCVIGALVIPSGTSQRFYSMTSARSANECGSASQVRTCINGVLDGSNVHQHAFCISNGSASCMFANQAIPHGSSVVAYSASNNACLNEVRVCNNGVLSGSYLGTWCTVSTATSTTTTTATSTATTTPTSTATTTPTSISTTTPPTNATTTAATSTATTSPQVTTYQVTVNPTSGVAPLTVQLSVNPFVTGFVYFGDGTSANLVSSTTCPTCIPKAVASHIYTSPGTYIMQIGNFSSTTITAYGAVTSSISVSSSTVMAGATTTITWSSANAATCTASGGWTGSKAISGTEMVTVSTSSNYTITCSGPSGSATSGISVTATPRPLPGYDIIILAGEANALSRGKGTFYDSYASDAIDARIFQLGRTGASANQAIAATWKSGNVTYDALQHMNASGTRTVMSLAIPFARRYATERLPSNRQVLIVPVAIASSSIHKWLGEVNVPPTAPVSLYDDLATRARIALSLPGNNKIVAVLWHQGESDIFAVAATTSNTGVQVYTSKFAELVSKFRTDFPSSGTTIPFIAGQMVYSWPTTQLDAIRTLIQNAQNSVLFTDGHGSITSSSGLAVNYPAYTIDRPDWLYFSNAGQVGFGDRYYQTWKQLMSPRSTGIATRTAFVNHLYQCVLSRTGNPTDVTNLVNAPAETTLYTMYTSFFGSSEYLYKGITDTAFVNQIYKCVLFRDPSVFEVSNVLTLLDTGLNRTDVLMAAIYGPEFQANIGIDLQRNTGYRR